MSCKEGLIADMLESHSHRSQEDVPGSRMDEVPTHQLEEFLVKDREIHC